MKIKNITLDMLPLNKEGIILDIDCKDTLKRRLLDLGLVNGTKIKPILLSPSKDPKAFQFRRSVIAIRKEDTKNIRVKF